MNLFKNLFNNKNIEVPSFKSSAFVRSHIFFSGRVQQVGFRYNTFDIANKLGLTGWVRNLQDGRVECEIQGEKEKIKFLIDYMNKLPISNIENIEYIEIPIIEEKEFKMR